jgi:hypothetical protein
MLTSKLYEVELISENGNVSNAIVSNPASVQAA